MLEVRPYLQRIGYEGPITPVPAVLTALHRAHLLAVPFENLDIHLGRPIVLSVDRFFEKIVRDRRGGFCYELNGLFAMLLTELGYRVTLLAARVCTPDGRLGPPYDHLALRVELAEPWLVDVGFGRHARHPLRLADGGDQRDPDGVYRVVPAGEFGDLEVSRDGEPQYRLETRPRELADFTATCWYHQTSPDSSFTRTPTCSLPAPGGRITLSGRRLIRTCGAERTERMLTEDEARQTYREVFGFELSTLPALRD